ncbi:MAG: polyprenyl synthetase family protein [Micromonosporaceae bacterium]|nr:polyprenyl synthetase family protein [Micromonosporaceae bacterium]
MDRADLRNRVGKALAEFLGRRRDECLAVDPALVPIAEAVEAFVLRGGKRLRPAFAYWGYRGAGGAESATVITALAALELLQASALIHDDVMDGSDTRRGQPAVHRRFAQLHQNSRWHGAAETFGTAAAILLGDLCLVWSIAMVHGAGLSLPALARALPIFDLMCTEVTLGQYLDVQTQAEGTTSTARASLIARFKSAKYTVERPMLLGAAIADAPEPLSRAYSAFGLPLGEAFQLRDDVLGVFGDPSRTGKPAGDDLREGKRTYLVAAALEDAGPAARATLLRGLGDTALDAHRTEELRDIIVSTGALAATERRIEELHATATTALATAPIDPEAREVLTGLAEAVVQRDL